MTIWLIDDEKEIHHALSLGLRTFRQVEQYRWFSDCTSALRLLRSPAATGIPDVILLDILLPDIKGIDAIPLLQDAAPTARIIMLTGDGRSASVVRSARLGINGYLLKPFRAADVVRACEEAMAGGIPMTAAVVPHLIQRLPAGARTPSRYRLTGVEQQILPYISKGYTDRKIADVMHVSFHTIRTHMKHIHRKLRTTSRSALAAKILREQLLP